MTPNVEQYSTRHLWQVAADMRSEDKDECLASAGLCPIQSLMWSVDASTYLRSFTVDGSAIAMLGVGAANLFAPKGRPWLLGTPGIRDHQTWFLKETRSQVSEMLKRHPFLENWVDARNLTSVRWLKWLGFSISEPEPYGVAQLPFHKFEMRGQ